MSWSSREIGRNQLQEPAVVVTARLSKKFYETFGEDVTNALVDWFNTVDATYRADLRELNETNFARFDAKLEQRLADMKAEVGAQFARLEITLSSQISNLKSETVKWMFGIWATIILAIVGIVFRG